MCLSVNFDSGILTIPLPVSSQKAGLLPFWGWLEACPSAPSSALSGPIPARWEASALAIAEKWALTHQLIWRESEMHVGTWLVSLFILGIGLMGSCLLFLKACEKI